MTLPKVGSGPALRASVESGKPAPAPRSPLTTSRISYAREKVADVRAAIMPLLLLHYAEIGQHDLDVMPDWDGYLKAESEDKLFILTARVDGALVGYNVMLLLHHPHYRDARVAQNDVIYVVPEYRRGRVGLGLIKYFEAAMRGCGFDKIYYHAKLANDFGRLLERMDYLPVETVYAKSLKVESGAALRASVESGNGATDSPLPTPDSPLTSKGGA